MSFIRLISSIAIDASLTIGSLGAYPCIVKGLDGLTPTEKELNHQRRLEEVKKCEKKNSPISRLVLIELIE